jgi:hypothetical protein
MLMGPKIDQPSHPVDDRKLTAALLIETSAGSGSEPCWVTYKESVPKQLKWKRKVAVSYIGRKVSSFGGFSAGILRG